MKRDYEKMTDNELHKLYYRTFGVFFAMQWDDDDMPGEATRSPIRGSEISLREFLDGFPKDEHGNALMLDYIPDNDQERRNIDPTVKAITDQFRRRKHGPNGAGE